jgi:hypothetical protein
MHIGKSINSRLNCQVEAGLSDPIANNNKLASYKTTDVLMGRLPSYFGSYQRCDY